jgi:hypothetical protein
MQCIYENSNKITSFMLLCDFAISIEIYREMIEILVEE